MGRQQAVVLLTCQSRPSVFSATCRIREDWSWSDFARELGLEDESETSSDKPQEPGVTGPEERGVPDRGDSRVTDTDEAGGVVMSDDEDDFETEWKRKETEKQHLRSAQDD